MVKIKVCFMILSILIATTDERSEMFELLIQEFNKQIRLLDAADKIEIVSKKDNKEMTIGAKRQWLLENANGKFIVFFDDDDKPYDWYCKNILDAIENHPHIDCIGLNIYMTTDGKRPQKCCHSLKYNHWDENVDGWDYVRNITHFNPVLKSKALQVGFTDIRFGEDKLYSDQISSILKAEKYIAEPMFHYRYTTTIPHLQKYGFKN